MLIFVFGGYNKELGTLNSIERYDINLKKVQLLEIKMPVPLRRFASIKISMTKILLMGGMCDNNTERTCFRGNGGNGKPRLQN